MNAYAVLLVAVTLLGPTEVSTSPPLTGFDRLLDDAREAVGSSGWEAQRDLRLSGQATYQGVEETFKADYARDGRFRLAFEGKLSRRSRFDGASVRLAEYSSIWYELEMFDREVELLRGLVHSGAWLDSAVALDISLAEDWQPAEGRVGLDIQLVDGLLPARLELDAEDHLVRSLSLQTGNGFMLSEYDDHRSVGGLKIAHQVRCDLSVGSEYSFRVTEAALAGTDRSLFSPVPDVLDYRFDTAVSADVPVVRSSSKHLWVRPLINGQDVGLFLFDTGAAFSGISAEAAEALGLDSFGESSLTGLGGGVRITSMRRAERVQLGPLIIENLVMSEVPVHDKMQMVQQKVGGVLGWDVLRRAIVDLEPKGNLRLYDSAGFELAEADWKPLHVNYQVPYISSRFSGDREGLFMLDCGAAGSTVWFFHHAAEALGLLDDDDEKAGPEGIGHGAGGEVRRRVTEIPWFDLAGHNFEELPIIVSTAPDGELDPYTLGLIGGGLLRNFRVVFDVQAGRVALIPLW
jgi:hypothetical protein